MFLVQGEGRGHMTQALSLSEILISEGHAVVAVGIGKSKRRKIPEFFTQGIHCPIIGFESPNFVCDQEQKKILLWETLIFNFAHTKTYYQSLKTINTMVETYQPDVIINFYELLGGLHQLIFRPKQRYWVIGHQYLTAHQEFPFAKGKILHKELFQLNTFVTAIRAEKLLALSFRPLPPCKNRKVIVLPPLLRKQLFDLSPREEDFILAYMVNPGYAKELTEQAKLHPEIKIEAFWDNKSYTASYQVLPNLIFHPINDLLFLQKMSACKAYITTAGFESVCEAMYLGKPVFMVPVKGQYEQACNAIDAEIAGAGIAHDGFDLTLLANYLRIHQSRQIAHQTWIGQSREMISKQFLGERDRSFVES
ncbi:glycosyltransferase family protein [Mongoliitalea daihaiensis]|uniref:glycosyltransferase family protein n=1 Tax=Mongoliitalea daihaiensis TaxID=2782006 RepID=UPI001F208059|nr:glycosyltransferase family protein [Mongoliitalea daihaiensis]UJP65029.1 glycosyltransferase [Mongoliitalea daihaiensis]